MSPYQQRIATLVPDVNPLHVEAWMRDQHGTLDGLSPQQFSHEVHDAAILARANPDLSESLANSIGLV